MGPRILSYVTVLLLPALRDCRCLLQGLCPHRSQARPDPAPRWRRRGSNYQLGRQTLLLRAQSWLGKLLQKQLDGDSSGLLEWQRDGRKLGGGHSGHEDVVEAHNADLMRHTDAAIGETAEDTEGHQIVEGDDCGHPSSNYEIGGVLAARKRRSERPDLDALERPAAGHCPQAATPLAVRPRLGRTAEKADPLVAEGLEVLDGLTHATGAVEQDGRHAAHAAVEEDEGSVLSELLELCLGQSRRADDDTVDLPGHRSHELHFEPWVLLRVRQEDGMVCLAGSRVATLEDRRKERIAKVRYDPADVARLPGRQASSGAARPVAQLLGHGEDTRQRLLADELGLREGSRDSGRRNVCAAGDIAY